jgi:nickel-dependent lactate racemase
MTEADMRTLVERFVATSGLAGKRVLAVIPDHTRSGPTGTWFRVIADALMGRARQIDFLIALGTHPPMPEDKINELLKLTPAERETKYASVRVYNHEWNNPAALRQVGTLSRPQVEELTNGMLSIEVPVKINKLVFDYDHVIICGPVFPHEVVGFSGGHKYFFPGIAAPEVINFTHWVGALLTNPVVNGTRETRVRAAIEACADLVPGERSLIGYVVNKDDVAGAFAGPVREAWKAATELSSSLHIKYIDKPYKTILSCAPKMYDDIWTAGKCMYKMEPAVADGGTLIIYAPHIDEVSYSHGKVLDEIGYHTRDYFVKQWDKFSRYPWGVVAHSTHVRGVGTYENGVEKPRVSVVLATRIPESRCRQINLGYMDPDSIDPADYANRESEGILMVPKAGEILYRLKDMSAFERLAGM